MIIAFIAGAAVFGAGMLIGAAIVQNTYDRVLARGGE
jgi:hypothetical protein